jgi:hypothetical protein
MRPAIERMKEEMERVGAELNQAMREFHEQYEAARTSAGDDHGRRAKRSRKSVAKKRPRKRPPAGETAPVRPRPKPTPLMDGAEAPVE